MEPRSVIQLVRAPAALSVPGDVLAGAAAGRTFGAATPALAASSCCLYWAGMALNDYADRDIDAAERPARPIPAGQVSARFALGLASGLTAAGLGIAALAGGRRALAVTAPLTATVWGYNLGLKNTPAGPAAMATARALDVLHGAGAGRLRPAAPAAVTMGAHTLAVTTLSRAEVTGSDRRLPATALAATAGVTAAVGITDTTRRTDTTGTTNTTARSGRTARGFLRAACRLAPLAVYTTSVGRAQIQAVLRPEPRQLQRAVGAGILGMIPLQSSLAASRGAYRSAATVMAAFPLARRLSRKVSPT
ncbi:4-hydroxybenzoate polyprenyltransferase [Halopolyspora algeriensis]|uniref:4-hydroxybenzoate polyprenyltransferase n=1 Tax=Halopolyspora algeriensis TaxID=1500506 RepID=A0A368VWT9_9ACTN|nr:4-hydroxybenzoate polyprenyltransferase [Halopolyspora algeriensis]TQM54161.1 4-hydroxybenzoate polyprenyltransferase [Halopolyspora algeriensis]